MNNKKHTNIILKELGDFLKPYGFKKLNNNFIRDNKTICLIIQLQKSRESNSSSIKVTINLGIFLWPLAHLLSTKLVRPSIEISHWRERIGYITNYKSDKWWVISSETDVSNCSNEIILLLQNEVLPLMESLASVEAIRELWIGESSPGLTESQRLKYLTELNNI